MQPCGQSAIVRPIAEKGTILHPVRKFCHCPLPETLSLAAVVERGVETVAYILMHRIGLDGVWLGYPISYCVVLALQFCYYQFFWKRKTHERLV